MFITFEGIEGSGKSTALTGVADYLSVQGYKVLCTREPGGSALGKNLRSTLLHEKSTLCAEAELFLFLADRAQHVQEVIKPALASGQWVLCDRYVDSTIAYQGAARGLDIEHILDLHKICTNDLWPDLTLLLDVPVAIGLSRVALRNSTQKNSINEKRFDMEKASFHELVCQNYHVRAALDQQRFKVINASNEVKTVINECIKVIETIAKERI